MKSYSIWFLSVFLRCGALEIHPRCYIYQVLFLFVLSNGMFQSYPFPSCTFECLGLMIGSKTAVNISLQVFILLR